MDGASILPILEACHKLELIVAAAQTGLEVVESVNKHIDYYANTTRIPSAEFLPDLQWFNTSQPLSLAKDLRGKIVILDFFTYGCINCQHVEPDIKDLERIYSPEDGVVIVGVHSPKFDNEKDSECVRNAVLRHDITHPVVHDPDSHLWNTLFITCWPTILILGPEGQIIFVLMGDGQRRPLLMGARMCLQRFKAEGRITFNSLPIRLEKDLVRATLENNFLSFPGKVCASPDGHCLAISDTGHHRIVITSATGVVMDIIGSGERGFQDGDASVAAFSSPQGICWSGENVLYVADSENHSVRKIDLFRGIVSTLAGNGTIGKDEEGGAVGSHQMLNTPFDVCLVHSQASKPNKPDVLLIAMAGFHQIWALAIEDAAHWYKREPHELDSAGACMRIYGSGKEEHRNNLNPLKAGFAQPSGLALDRDKMILYVADSESSSIRSIALLDGVVRNVVGGSRDPTDLFTFGDVDGISSRDIRLQHPLGLAYSHRLRMLLVTDTYNHKVKFIDPILQTCLTLVGDGKHGDADGLGVLARLNEPGGLSLSESTKNTDIYIADTNNHCIKAVDCRNNISRKIQIKYRPDILARNPVKAVVRGDSADNPVIVNLLPVYFNFNEAVVFNANVPHATGIKADFDSQWAILVNPHGVLDHLELYDLNGNALAKSEDYHVFIGSLPHVHKQSFVTVSVKDSLPPFMFNFMLTLDITGVYFDPIMKVCFRKNVRFKMPFRRLNENSKEVHSHCVDLIFVFGK